MMRLRPATVSSSMATADSSVHFHDSADRDAFDSAVCALSRCHRRLLCASFCIYTQVYFKLYQLTSTGSLR